MRISIGSFGFCVGLTNVTNRTDTQTDHATTFVATGRIAAVAALVSPLTQCHGII